MRGFIIDIKEYILNNIVTNIPSWHVRRFFYKISGMKIGKNSHILMGCRIMHPWNIEIGDGTYINERCFLDGRGGVKIGNNVSISIGTSILTGTHVSNSSTFEYVDFPVVIEDNVWTGINSIIMPGVVLPVGCILASGSVAIKNKIGDEKFIIYSGVPAIKIGNREISELYKLGDWNPHFR